MRLIPFLLTGSIVLAPPLDAQTYRNDAAMPASIIAFGAATAVTGEEVLVARPGLASGFPVPPTEAGAVHVFRRNAQGQWTEAAMVTAQGSEVGDGFGAELTLDGSWLAVGATGADSGRGAVHLFERDRAGQWAWRTRLTLPDALKGDRFGGALALAGDVLIAGVAQRDSARGIAVAFRRNGADWVEAGRLEAEAPMPGERFGLAVAIAGDAVLVGAPGPGGNPQVLRPGRTVVFGRSASGAWSERGVLTVSDTTARLFGAAIETAGDQAYISSPYAGTGPAVLLFGRQGDAWTQVARIAPDTALPQSGFGTALALDGHDLLVGAPNAGGGAGAVYVMRHDPATDGWSEAQRLSMPNVGIGLQVGASVAAWGGLAVVGAPLADFLQGKGYVYRRAEDGTWRETGVLVGDPPSRFAPVTGGEVECGDGHARIFGCQNVDLVAFLPSSALGARRGIWVNDLWGWTDPESGREYAIVGRIDATTFVDITDPANPVLLGELPLHEGAQPNLWRDIKVYQDHAFIVSDGAGPHGMQVFDLTRLRRVANPPETFTEDAHYDRMHSAHNIVIDTTSGFAYTVGNSMGGETCGGALHMVDIRDPKNPTFAGCYGDPATGFARTGYTHDAQCVVYNGPDEAYRGRQICFNASETALGIADVTDKSTPKAVASATYPNVAYAHQGWLSDDHRYFYLNDEGDELSGTADRTRTLIFDVQDLDDPVMVHAYLGETAATDHNLYVNGRYLYESNYVSGLRIIDVSDPTNPVEVGYFDTVPFGENAPGFAGSWSNYPFFKSGVIAVTSINEGLFLLRFNPPTPVP